MNGMIFRRTVNSANQITLPQAVVRECGIQNGEALDIITMQDGNGFLVKKLYNRCHICGRTTDLRRNRHLCICEACLGEFKKEAVMDECENA